MNNASIRFKLIVMNFLEFGVWGAYLTSMGSYLAQIGLGDKIWLFFAMQGIVSIFMPAIVGIIADKYIEAQKMLSLCHGIGGLFILAAGLYCMSSGTPQFGPLFALYSTSIAFFMPTIGLSYSVAYKILEKAGLDTVSAFPPIRVFGTVGFICSMLFTNFMKNGAGVQFQNSFEQFLSCGTLEVVLCAYALTLPRCDKQPNAEGHQSFVEATGLKAFKLFKRRDMAIFFIFSMLLGAALQITNGYANTYISSFKDNPQFASTWGANNANALISLSQLSETLCILLIPWAMKKFKIKGVMLIAMFAWVLRFGLFGLGNPGNGVWMLILSCLVYGVAFDFFNISGSLYVNKNTGKDIQSSAQGLFMLMTNGLGASIGTWVAGIIVNNLVYNAAEPSWSKAWLIFATYSFVIAVLFIILFKNPEKAEE